jgi:hypothetical protein
MITLTPQARAIAAFAVSFALVAGYLNRIGFALTLMFGDALPSGRGGTLIAGLFTIAVAAIVLWFTAMAAKQEATGWALHLCQAAVVLAALGTGIAVIVTIGAVAHGNAGVPGSYFPYAG